MTDKLTALELRRMLKLRQCGLTYREIGEKVGNRPRQMVEREIRKVLKLSTGISHNVVDNEKVEE